MKSLLILDNTFTVRNRIRELVSKAGIEVIETTTPKQLMSVLVTRDDIGLIITELDFPEDEGFTVLAEIKDSAGEIPVMILTGENKRSMFIKGIRMGASDYILKPFDDDFLYKRILELMGTRAVTVRSSALEDLHNKAEADAVPAIFVDFRNYLDKELKKAYKGKYPVTVMLSLFTRPVATTTELERAYHDISSDLYPEICGIMFDTDLVMKYGSQGFVAVLPFCDYEQQEIVDLKLKKIFETFVENKQLPKDFLLINAYAVYPHDGTEREGIMSEAEQRLTDQMLKIRQ